MRGLATPIILVLVLAGLGGYIFLVEVKKPATTTEVKPKAFDVSADAIEELQVAVTGGDTSVARLADKNWKLVQLVEADADASQLTNMASSLASLEIQRVVDENPSDLAQFGLNPPKVEISFKTTGKKDIGSLQIGDKTPSGGDVYAKRPDGKRVFLISSFIEDTFKRSAFELRDKTLMRFDREKLDGLELTTNGMSFQFALKGLEWTIVKPTPMRADYASVEALISTLSSTLTQKFVADQTTPEGLRQYGLDKPVVSASVLMGSARATLLVGKTDKAETFAKDASRPVIMSVAPTIVADLSKGLEEFRRKELFDMRSFNTTRVELKRGADTFVFEKTADKDGKDAWKNAAGKDVDAAKVEELLTKLSSLRSQSFEAGTPAALKTPDLTAQVTFGENKDDRRTETVSIAKAGDKSVASRSDEPGTGTLDVTALDDVMKALDAVK